MYFAMDLDVAYLVPQHENAHVIRHSTFNAAIPLTYSASCPCRILTFPLFRQAPDYLVAKLPDNATTSDNFSTSAAEITGIEDSCP